MSKIINSKVKCACCKKQVNIDRVLSFASSSIGLSGNKHTPMQYRMEECPECHYVSLDIEDNSIEVSEDVLNSFCMPREFGGIKDPDFIRILKTADVYKKNKDYLRYGYALRLASFLAEKLEEISISRTLLEQANDALQKYFEGVDELSMSDIMSAVNLIDGKRRRGMTEEAENMCNEVLALIKESGGEEITKLRRLLEFENTLLEKHDTAEHLISEVL